MPNQNVPNFKENYLSQNCLTSRNRCLPQNCICQGKIPKSAYLKYFQTQLKSAYIQILHCSRLPSSRVYCILQRPFFNVLYKIILFSDTMGFSDSFCRDQEVRTIFLICCFFPHAKQMITRGKNALQYLAHQIRGTNQNHKSNFFHKYSAISI